MFNEAEWNKECVDIWNKEAAKPEKKTSAGNLNKRSKHKRNRKRKNLDKALRKPNKRNKYRPYNLNVTEDRVKNNILVNEDIVSNSNELFEESKVIGGSKKLKVNKKKGLKCTKSQINEVVNSKRKKLGQSEEQFDNIPKNKCDLNGDIKNNSSQINFGKKLQKKVKNSFVNVLHGENSTPADGSRVNISLVNKSTKRKSKILESEWADRLTSQTNLRSQSHDCKIGKKRANRRPNAEGQIHFKSISLPHSAKTFEEICQDIETSIKEESAISPRQNRSMANVTKISSKAEEFKKKKRKRLQKALIQQENCTLSNKPVSEQPDKNSNNRNKKQSKTETSKCELEYNDQIDDRSNNLRQKMLARLSSGNFRYLNEQLYSVSGDQAQKLFQNDLEAYKVYHKGFQNQVEKWPVNPVDLIISQIQNLPAKHVVADFGCGTAKLAQTFPQRTIHSFDLVALNSFVTSCNMSKVPLKSTSIDVTVFCLSLMGSNLEDYILEANRVLKNSGLMKIAELESRFENSQEFINNMRKYGFRLIKKEELNDYFLIFDFKKISTVKKSDGKLPRITLKPCLYKRR